ncbi:M-phase phosphoprotein 8-like isoform X1 [Centruroides sculpturatus]|uniref:M-phase phosphoprotein 8-like isoform X1 n=1 Tax=Centruroides sculpturatus TaxID=218467 RepID=UPI000C6EBF90|nr:M-phase phosphoprotein 8-like isoform X1 [Centruroides sculpturatus]
MLQEEETQHHSMDIGRRLVEDEKDVYEVEAITGMKELNGKMYYKVRWTGYHVKESTWEPQENLLTCMDMVETYVQSRVAKQKAKQDALEANDKPVPPKDTFWKDFEEGKINVFEQDMYSRVKKARSQKEKLQDSVVTSLGDCCSNSKDSNKKENSISLSKRKHSVLQSNLTYTFQRRRNKRQNIIIKSADVTGSDNQESDIFNHDYKSSQKLSEKSEPEDTELTTKWIKRHKNKERNIPLNALQRSQIINNEKLLQKSRKTNGTKEKETNWSLNCSVLVENIKLSNVPLNLGPDSRMLIKNTEDGYKITACNAKSRLLPIDTAIPSSKKEDSQQENNSNSSIFNEENIKLMNSTNSSSTALTKNCINVKNGDYKNNIKLHGSWNDEQFNNTITPLALAVLKGDTEEAKLLISQGEDVNLKLKSGCTVLMVASEQGDVKMVLTLLEMGAKKEIKNFKGETALIMASRKGHFDVVQQLLDHGANFSVCNNEGMTALRVSSAAAQTAVRNLLNNHITRIKYAFEAFINKLLKGSSCKVLHALFPLHCFTLNEGPDLYITFCHGVPTERQGNHI